MDRFRILTTFGVVAVTVSACAMGHQVEEAAAVLAATQACDQSWGEMSRRNGNPFHVDESQWHAHRSGDHWHVWMGDENMPGLSVDAPLNGSHLDPKKSCKMLMQ